MPDLIAQGPQPHERWRRRLAEGQSVVVGRSAGAWSVPWDSHVSRQHAQLRLRGNKLIVEKIEAARNPIFVSGKESEKFALSAGEHFVVGETTFTLADEKVAVTVDAPDPVAEQTFSPKYLRGVQFRNANQRITVLSRLPDLISNATNDSELCVQLVNLLLAGVPRASAAAVIASTTNSAGDQSVEVLHWDRRLLESEDFQPSQQLIRQAIESHESVLHIWGSDEESDVESATIAAGVDWAFATPVGGDACSGWTLYVHGAFGGPQVSPLDSGPEDLRDDLKFAELVATTLGNLRDVRMLERSQTSLSQFFSPIVMEAIEGQDPDVVLAPRETEVSVLFCDLRGFSRKSEQMSSDLLGLLERVSRALGVTTHEVLEHGGVIGDFHGDAAMGFWGWPIDQDDAACRAGLAALGIRRALADAAGKSDHPLGDFRMGVGIATGRAVAGKIGTVDQVKVTVFGPVVNLASRLEGMTSLIHAPILLDERSAANIRQLVAPDVARVRRVAVVQPYGMNTPVEISELLPPQSEYPQLSDDHIAAYEAALDALLDRDWEQAFQLLHEVPANDRAKDFLTVFIAQHGRTAPDNWNGVIPLTRKSG